MPLDVVAVGEHVKAKKPSNEERFRKSASAWAESLALEETMTVSAAETAANIRHLFASLASIDIDALCEKCGPLDAMDLKTLHEDVLAGLGIVSC